MVAGNVHAINKSSSASHTLITAHNGESALNGLLNPSNILDSVLYDG